jgi:hypothetical protein
MIFLAPSALEAVDQGDIIDDCPTVRLKAFDPVSGKPDVAWDLARVYALTQTCDLAQSKTTLITIAAVLDASQLVSEGTLKAAEVRGPIRAGRVYGWYFLPRSASLGLPESIVDFRQIYNAPLTVLETLCRAGKRRARLQSLYREHLAKHFADAYSRIGLPMPYETD